MVEHLRLLRQNQEGSRITCHVFRFQICRGVPVQRTFTTKEKTNGEFRKNVKKID